MVQELVLDWDSGSDSSAASAGVGTIGDTIGATTAEEYVTTTTPTFRIAELSSTAGIFGRVEGTSTTASIDLVVAALAGNRTSIRLLRRTHRRECIPEPSAGSIMVGLREATHPEDKPALGASTVAEAAASAAAEVEALTAVEAGIDSSYEVT